MISSPQPIEPPAPKQQQQQQQEDQQKKLTKDMSNVALMDIGEHCSYCGQIDFLPFKCSCSKTFCLQHRTKESHQCIKIDEVDLKRQKMRDVIDTSHLPSAKSLFPDRSQNKIQLRTVEDHPVSIMGDMQKRLKGDSSALNKLRRFFDLRLKEGKTKKSSSTKGPAKRMVEMSMLKSKAKGDPRVSPTERIHVWVQVIDDESKFDKVERHAFFISRGWPLGRALDSIAQELKLKNLNNRTTDQSQKLFLFKELDTKDGGVQKLETSGRCNVLKDGETLFVVRGTEEL